MVSLFKRRSNLRILSLPAGRSRLISVINPISPVRCAIAGLLLSLTVHAQAPAPPPPVAAQTRSAGTPSAQAQATSATAQLPATPAQQDSSPVATIRAYSNLVVIDVVVSDSKGNPVHGLKKEDFTLTENGKPQSIRSFDEHTAMPPSETAKLAPMPTPHPGIFTNKSPMPADGPVNVLLLDYLNTPLTAQPYARKQLIELLDRMPPGTRIAIFALTTNLTMLQGFTSDPEVLKKALNSSKGAVQASDILTDPVSGGPQGNTTLSDNFSSDAIDAAQQLANIQRSEAIEASFEQDLRTKVTLSGFEELARYLVGIPGRKNVIWFSGSFPLSIEPDVNLQDAFDSVVRNDEEVRKTDNLLTRAQIAVYPVDARGVFSNPGNNATNGPSGALTHANGDVGLFGSASSGGNSGSGSSDPGSTPGSADAAAQLDFLQQTAQEHETMLAMAEDTGGHAYINTNNLTQAVLQAIANGSNYYTLTYTPTNTQWDGRFRAIKVKVEQSGLKLAYREGYYADDPNDRNRVVAGSSAVALARPTTMSTAMMHGGPDQTEIPFKVRIRPSAEPPSNNPASSDRTNPDPKVNVTGPFKDYSVDLVPDPHAISCPSSADGNLHCAIQVATYVYNPEGVLLVTTTANARTALKPQEYAQMLHTGLAFHQDISVPVKGQYYLRTAIHDLKSDRVGAVEVPVASVAHLPPLDQPKEAPAATLDDAERMLERAVPASASSNPATPGSTPGAMPSSPPPASSPSAPVTAPR